MSDVQSPGTAFIVVARFCVLPEHVSWFARFIDEIAHHSRQEAGVLEYRCFRDQSEPNVFFNVEEYKDAGAYEAHLRTAHVKAGLDELDQKLSCPLDVRYLQELSNEV